jgi:biopolymer transport protein ExbD
MISVSLPKSSEARAEVLRTNIISIDRQGVIYFNSMRVGLEALNMKLGDIKRDTPIIVQADRDVTLQIFVDVLDLLNKRGFKKVAIQTERRG